MATVLVPESELATEFQKLITVKPEPQTTVVDRVPEYVRIQIEERERVRAGQDRRRRLTYEEKRARRKPEPVIAVVYCRKCCVNVTGSVEGRCVVCGSEVAQMFKHMKKVEAGGYVARERVMKANRRVGKTTDNV